MLRTTMSKGHGKWIQLLSKSRLDYDLPNHDIPIISFLLNDLTPKLQSCHYMTEDTHTFPVLLKYHKDKEATVGDL